MQPPFVFRGNGDEQGRVSAHHPHGTSEREHIGIHVIFQGKIMRQTSYGEVSPWRP